MGPMPPLTTRPVAADDYVRRWHDENAAHWDETMYASRVGAAIRESEMRVVLDLMGPVDDLRVLDAGTGTGRFAAALLRAGADKVHGIDVAERMMERADRRCAEFDTRFERSVMSVHELDLPEASFDRVCCVGVIEHVPDARTAIEQLGRVLRPGGRLVLATANGESLYRGLMAWLEHRITGLPKLFQTETELRGWLAEAGLAPERTAFCGLASGRRLGARVVVSARRPV